MKRILIAAAAALLLAGCALMTPAKFDSLEQHGWATLWQQAKRLEMACGQPARVRAIVGGMFESAELLGAYIQYQPDNGSQAVMRGFAALQEHAPLLADSSVAFCRESARNLQAAAERAMQVNGGRER